MKTSRQCAIHVSCVRIEVIFNRQNVPLAVNQVSPKRELFLPSVPLASVVDLSAGERYLKIVGFVSLTDYATTIFIQ